VSSTCFEHPSVHPQEDLYMKFLVFLSCVRRSSLVDGRMCLIKHCIYYHNGMFRIKVKYLTLYQRHNPVSAYILALRSKGHSTGHEWRLCDCLHSRLFDLPQVKALR